MRICSKVAAIYQNHLDLTRWYLLYKLSDSRNDHVTISQYISSAHGEDELLAITTQRQRICVKPFIMQLLPSYNCITKLQLNVGDINNSKRIV